MLAGLMTLVTKVSAMGLLGSRPLLELTPKTLVRIFDALQKHGLLRVKRAELKPLLAEPPGASPVPIATALQEAISALEESPAPASEWGAMREVFGDDQLAQLLDISISSLRRYAASERTTPDHVADRLHYLAMVVAELAGSYNDWGIRRWFERPRAQLGGKSPRAVLGKKWDSTTRAAQRVRELARSLSGAGGT